MIFINVQFDRNCTIKSFWFRDFLSLCTLNCILNFEYGACLHFLQFFASKERGELQDDINTKIIEQKLLMNTLYLKIRTEFLLGF